MNYQSTRGGERGVSPSLAIVKGLAKDGGLFVPSEIPSLPLSVRELSELSYQDLAYEIMKLYFTDFTEEELRYCISSAYDTKFDTEEIAPVVKNRDFNGNLRRYGQGGTGRLLRCGKYGNYCILPERRCFQFPGAANEGAKRKKYACGCYFREF